MSETKYVSETLVYSGSGGGSTFPSTYVNFNSVINTAADWYRCLPVTGQGVDSFQRIGNRIKPTSVTCKWNFRFDVSTTDDQSRDIDVHLFILKEKARNKYVTGTTAGGQMEAAFNSFLDKGDGTNDGFGATFRHVAYPIDNSSVTLVKRKIIRLFKAPGVMNSNDAIGNAAEQPMTWCAKHSHTFKKVPTLKYELATSVIPDNFNYVWAVGYTYRDGTAADKAGGLLKVDCETQMRFKDE